MRIFYRIFEKMSIQSKVDFLAKAPIHRFLNGLENILIACAAAQVTRNELTQLRIGVKLTALKDFHRRHDEARGAESALHGRFLNESLLNIAQFPVGADKTLERTDGFSVCPGRKIV